jgi:hypothetical protein
MKNTSYFVCSIRELVSQDNSISLITIAWTRGESCCYSRRDRNVALHNFGYESKQLAIETTPGMIFRRWSVQERETDHSYPVTAGVKLRVPHL